MHVPLCIVCMLVFHIFMFTMYSLSVYHVQPLCLPCSLSQKIKYADFILHCYRHIFLSECLQNNEIAIFQNNISRLKSVKIAKQLVPTGSLCYTHNISYHLICRNISFLALKMKQTPYTRKHRWVLKIDVFDISTTANVKSYLYFTCSAIP